MKKSNQVYYSSMHQRPIAVDFYWNNDSTRIKPVVLFMHGFKGFKDWGHWAAIAAVFAEAGYCFVAMNFSHNGTTLEQPLDFATLEAFGHNNYSKELADVHTVIEEIRASSPSDSLPALDKDNITLIGHSRGGPIALITALEQASVQRVVTWASVHALDYRWANDEAQVQEWKEQGVVYVYNGRTQQQMPLYYQLYEDFQANKERLSVDKTLAQLNKPHLIVHGTADPAVSSTSADYLEKHGRQAQKVLIEDANHVFGGKHPFDEEELPLHSHILAQKTLEFIQQTS